MNKAAVTEQRGAFGSPDSSGSEKRQEMLTANMNPVLRDPPSGFRFVEFCHKHNDKHELSVNQ